MANIATVDDPCDVCGDVACAYNNQGLTCHSCRMFFRRHAPNREQLECLKEGKCKIDFITRKCCQKCRLEKCFAIGMKMRKQVQIRPRKVYQPKIPTLSDKLDRYIEDEMQYIGETEEDNSELNLNEPPTVINAIKSLDLTLYENQQINEVHNAMSVFVEENDLEVKGSIRSSLDVLRLLSLYARRIIRFCKSISAFKLLCQDDQLIILKPFYFEILVYRVAYMYDEERHGFRCIQNELADSVLFIYMQKTNNSPNDKAFVRILHDEMEKDVIIRNLFIAQSLFKPRDNISCPEFIRYHYIYYTHLLKRYLEHKYQNLDQANEKFFKLMDINQDFCRVREKILQYLKTIDINQIGEIMAEVFDMKP